MLDTTASSPIETRLAAAGLNGPRRALIQTTLENPDETIFMSARALARRNNVSAATVVRTVQALGYQHYSEFAADLREHFFARLSPYDRMQALGPEGGSLPDQLNRSLDRDIGSLSRLKAGLDSSRVSALAQRIHASRSIVVVGADLAHALASFLNYGLVLLGFAADAPAGSDGALQHRVHLMGRDDLLIAISFGRCLRVTVEAAAMARRQGVATFGITDNDTTPIARNCDGYLLASIAGSTAVGSYAAPMALVNAILLACTQLKPKRSLRVMRKSAGDYLAGARWYEPAASARSAGNGRAR